jgi:hypothetical protein
MADNPILFDSWSVLRNEKILRIRKSGGSFSRKLDGDCDVN